MVIINKKVNIPEGMRSRKWRQEGKAPLTLNIREKIFNK